LGHGYGGSANELASFNIVVEKGDLSKIGGKRGGYTGTQGATKGHMTPARAGTSNTRAAAQEAASSIQDPEAGMPATAHKRLFSSVTLDEIWLLVC
jgi:hypothetical protein